MQRVHRYITCTRQIEVEVLPATVELSFADDLGANPINAQARFEAIVYNGRSAAVKWDVRDVNGNPGAGTIDATGRYLAPAKNALASGVTDIVVATSVEDPLRKAFAFVTLVGTGPAVAPAARIAIRPKTAYLYYPQNQTGADRNEFIDVSNKQQVFRASVWNANEAVEWLVDGVLTANPAPSTLFRYQVNGSGSTTVVVITARLAAQPAIADQAKVVQINYRWP
jgi:hypothetical protein